MDLPAVNAAATSHHLDTPEVEKPVYAIPSRSEPKSLLEARCCISLILTSEVRHPLRTACPGGEEKWDRTMKEEE